MIYKVKGEKREVFGKNASRRLRREGKIPAILYGPELINVSLTLDKKDLFQILRSDSGENTIFEVSFDSQAKDVMLKDVQMNPVTDELLHVDLIVIAMDKEIRVEVPVILVGEAIGVKAEGGFIDLVTRELEIECLPASIPEHIDVDITSLHLHQSIKVGDLVPPQGVSFITEPNIVIALVHAQLKEEVVVEEVEEAEVITDEAQPELIKKEKPDQDSKKEED
ncbi:MAG: 50S ribosomal protein L25 [Candidatus Aminicenantes bacterium]|nr:50S ribosomal protein L25 [Candidatus Aminicenantes bacterium]